MKRVWNEIMKGKDSENSKHYWKMIKKLRKTTRNEFPNEMICKKNGIKKTKPKEILEIFSDRYEDVKFSCWKQKLLTFANVYHFFCRTQQ